MGQSAGVVQGGAGSGIMSGAKSGLGGGLFSGVMKGINNYNNTPDVRMVDLGNGYRAAVITSAPEKLGAMTSGVMDGVLGGVLGGVQQKQADDRQVAQEERADSRWRKRMEEQIAAQEAEKGAATRERLMTYAAQGGLDLSGLGNQDGPPASNEALLSRIAGFEAGRADAKGRAEAALSASDAAAEKRDMLMRLIESDKWNEGNARALGLDWPGAAASGAATEGGGTSPSGPVHQALRHAAAQQAEAQALAEKLRESKAVAAPGGESWWQRLFKPSEQSSSVLQSYR